MRDARAIRPDSESGAAVLAVMAFSALIMVLVLGTVGRVVSEARAIEDSLTQNRAYWAAQGISNYVLSRAMGTGACSGACAPSNPITQLQGFANEIAPAAIWLYPEVSSVYRIATNFAVTQDTATEPTWSYLHRVTFGACPSLVNGVLGTCAQPATTVGPLSVTLPGFSYPDALRSLLATRPVEIRYCFVTARPAACAPGAKTLGAGTSWNAITSIHRPSK